MGEITVILLLALIFLGPSKLPELASGLGRLIKEIRKTTSDVKNEIQLDESIRKPFDDLRDAMTLHPDELKRRDLVAKELEEARARLEAEVRAISDTVGDAVNEAAIDPGASSSHTMSGLGEGAETAEGQPLPPPSVLEGTSTAEAVANVPSGPPGTVPRVESPRHETPAYVSPGAPAGPLPGGKSGPLAAGKTGGESVRTTLKGTGDAGQPRTPRPGIPAPTRARVSPPGPTADPTNATQFLSEDDLLPSDAARSTPPPPPAAARLTGQHKIVPPPPGKPPGDKKG
jgi:Sec-independent protein translocase protein TatA